MSPLRFNLIPLAIALAISGSSCKQKPAAQQKPEADLSASSDIFRQPVPETRNIPTSGPIAVVNGKEIPAETFQKEITAVIGRLQRQYPPEQLAQILPRVQEDTLDKIIARELLIQEADRLKITVSDEEFAAARARLESSFPPGMSLARVLEQRNVGEDQFKKEFGEEVRITKLMEQATSNQLQVTEAEAKAFYEQNSDKMKRPEFVSARHILVAVKDETDKETAKAKAEALRERLMAGEDFATLAAAESDDPGSRATGGLYSFARNGQMVKPFEDAAFTQEIGVVGPLVETQFGYHIIKVESREPARDVPLAEAQSNIVAYLRAQRAPNTIRDYLSTLRSNAEVKLMFGN